MRMNLKRIDKIEAMGYKCRIYDLQSELLERMNPQQVKQFDIYLSGCSQE